jgi:hypothetical protein
LNDLVHAEFRENWTDVLKSSFEGTLINSYVGREQGGATGIGEVGNTEF